MASDDDLNSEVPGARPGRFVVSHPCNPCHGKGDIGGQPCPTCRGTGSERFFHGTKVDLKTGDLIEPLRVIGEVVKWRGHDHEELKAMKDSVERAKQQGVEPID